MERKIGEIFNYQDNWYQCIENTGYGCIICHFNTHNNICCNNVLNIIGNCLPPYRKDNTSVIFKKLEKIGEPTMLDGKLVQKILTTDGYSCNGCCFKSPECDKADDDLCCKYEIYVEIKQNKENMEEETKLPKEDNALTRTVHDYVNGKISDKELIESIKEMSDEYPYIKDNLKPFDLEAAKAGKPVCTRDGRKARIICFDAKCIKPIVALIQGSDNSEQIEYYTENGVFSNGGTGKNRDLMILLEKKEGWINIYNRNTISTSKENCYIMTGVSVFKTKESAISYKDKDKEYIDTIKIEWEE